MPAETETSYHADGLPSIVRITDQDGDVVKSYDHDPWGNRTESGTLTVDGVDYGFTGREWDPETGLYYYRARYYDPKVGRFISEDPIGLNGGINRYVYVLNSPALHEDPLGLCAKDPNKPCPKCPGDVQGAMTTVCKDAPGNKALPVPMRKCLKEKCQAGVIVCCPSECTYREPGSADNVKGIEICPNARNPECFLKQTVLHEMLHNCLFDPAGEGAPQESFIEGAAKRSYPCSGGGM